MLTDPYHLVRAFGIKVYEIPRYHRTVTFIRDDATAYVTADADRGFQEALADWLLAAVAQGSATPQSPRSTGP